MEFPAELENLCRNNTAFTVTIWVVRLEKSEIVKKPSFLPRSEEEHHKKIIDLQILLTGLLLFISVG